ncbi:MAG TPA: crossover junction endodeoxyribonuclease RuvC [Polyangiaceae bacterium]
MLVLGVDPGTRHLGWGLVHRTGTRLKPVGFGIISPDPELSLAERLVTIEKELTALIEQYRPDAGSVESLFYSKDPQAAAKLGHARGVVLLVLARSQVEVFEYAPALVKRMIAGRGNADKRQVGLMMQALLCLDELPGVDATDALALAVTHLRLGQLAKTNLRPSIQMKRKSAQGPKERLLALVRAARKG